MITGRALSDAEWRRYMAERFSAQDYYAEGGATQGGRETGPQDFDLLTMSDVAQLLHCSKAHVCKAVAGRVPGCQAIPCVSLGRRKLVRRQSLLAWLAQNESRPNGTMASLGRDAAKRT